MDCPTPETLNRYAAGELSAPEAAAVDSHLGDCADCLRQLDGASSTPDPLVAALRKPRAGSASEPALARAVAVVLGDTPPPLAPTGPSIGAVVNGYRLVEEIGRGGMGRVYRAAHPRLDREVALKLLRPGLDSAPIVARFEAERRALARMDHPNIARVFDGGATDDERPFVVMELVRGVPVTRYCDEHRLDLAARLRLFVDVCHAVQHAHQKGVIHRDLKPSNVLVADYDGRPVVKVIDFGVAKPIDRPSGVDTEIGMVIGTPELMSPEQAALTGTDVDTRSDVYALGGLAYDLVTGDAPLGRARLRTAPLLEVLRIVREEEPFPPSTRLGSITPEVAGRRDSTRSTLIRQVRGDLDWVILKALEKDRDRRYATAAALAEDVRRYLANEPVHAAPPSRSYLARKFVRRNLGAVLTTAALAAALIAGIAGTAWQAIRATNAEQTARLAATAALDAERAARLAERTAIAERNRAKEAEALATAHADTALAAEKRARASASRARVAERDTAAFAEFLANDVLAAARPASQARGLGVNATMVQVLEAADKKLDTAFQDQPRAEFRARHALGVTWRNLGRYKDAERHLRRALELSLEQHGLFAGPTLDCYNSLGVLLGQAGKLNEAFRTQAKSVAFHILHYGPFHRLTLHAQTNLAVAIQRLGHIPASVALYELTLRLQTLILEADHANTLRTRTELASAYLTLRQTEDALALAEATLPKALERLGPDDPLTHSARTSLAYAYRMAGRPADALPIAEEALRRARDVFGPDHVDTLSAMTGVASTFTALGRHAEAIALHEQAHQLWERRVGPSHSQTLRSLNNLAVAHKAAGHLREAIGLMEKNLELTTARFGPSNLQTLDAENGLATMLAADGRLDDAVARYTTVIRGRIPLIGAGHREVGQAADNLFAACDNAGRLELAIPVFTDLVTVQRKSLAESNPVYRSTLARLGDLLARSGRGVEAEPILRECLADAARRPPGWGRFNLASLLGGALLEQKRYSEAEPLLLEGYQGLVQHQAKMTPLARQRRLPEAIQRLIALYSQTDRPDQAAQWRSRLDAPQ